MLISLGDMSFNLIAFWQFNIQIYNNGLGISEDITHVFHLYHYCIPSKLFFRYIYACI